MEAGSDAFLEAKKALRLRILEARDALEPGKRDALSAQIIARLLALPGYRTARVVAAYSSFGSELSTIPFLQDVIRSRRALLLPRIDRAQRALVFHGVRDLADLQTGPWGIREPDPARCPSLDLQAVDFMLVPGVAFTARSERLGYGGGYYDRVLAGLSARTARIAGAFALQIVESLPTGPYDRKVDGVITESDCYGRAQA